MCPLLGRLLLLGQCISSIQQHQNYSLNEVVEYRGYKPLAVDRVQFSLGMTSFSEKAVNKNTALAFIIYQTPFCSL